MLNLIFSSLTRQLPFNVPFSVKVSLIENCFDDWNMRCVQCFDAVHDATAEQLRSLVQKHFNGFSGTTLLGRVHSLCMELVERCRQQTLERLDFLLQMEDPPFTLNDHYFSACREGYLAQYKAARRVSTLLGFNTRRLLM